VRYEPRLRCRCEAIQEAPEYDLIIIGGGPAALAAATFARGKRLELGLIYEQLGGWNGAHQRIVAQDAEEHIAGEALVQLMAQDIGRCGCALQDHVVRVVKQGGDFAVTTERHGVLEARAVLVATGARPIPLQVPGADEFQGQGLGYSTTTHAQLLAGKTAAVVGSSERALRGALELAQTNTQVYLVADDADEEAPLLAALETLPNVVVLAGYRVREITGGFSVEEIVVEGEGQTRRIAIDALFADCGLEANSAVVANLAQTDAHGFIKVDERRGTSVVGLFAAGDVTTAVGEQKLIAIGEGARAARSAYGYVLARRAEVRLAPRAVVEA
jgi:thioredoxin reductase (NADPH)